MKERGGERGRECELGRGKNREMIGREEREREMEGERE